MNTEVITIDSITVKQDAEGRYCLNDLHKAAGGAEKDKPSLYLQTQKAQALVAQISKGRDSSIKPVESKRGKGGGTFAVRELVYDYAMWISAEFNLKVIRAYDTLATQGVAVHESAAADLIANPLKYIEALMGQAKQLVAENERLKYEASRCSMLEFCTRSGRYFSPSEKGILSQRATAYSKEKGLEITKKAMQVNVPGVYNGVSEVSVYDVAALEYAMRYL